MKVAIINDSGNVGKSLLSRELFYPKMENGIIIEVETSNSSSKKFAKNMNIKKIYGDEFDTLFTLMYQYDNFVLDIGKSQIERFLKELKKSDEILDDIDLIIIPVTSDDKIQEDTLKLLEILDNMGVKDKVRVILNRADNLREFNEFINEAKEINYKIDTNLRILNYDVFKKLGRASKNAFELANDDRDLKAMSQKAFRSGNEEDGTILAELDYMKKFSKGITKNMDKIYALLLATM